MDSAITSFSVSQEEFVLFHKIDRELYKVLVMNLLREPAESIQVLAMWLWLENVGFRNVVHKITSLPFILINEVADETVMWLNCINNIPSPESNDNILILQGLMEREISLKFFCENRVHALKGVAKMVQDVCLRAIGDLVQEAILMRNNNNTIQRNLVSGNQLWFGSIGPGLGPRPVRQGNEVVPPDDRTLFVTFSKGYRVEEWEVREYFMRAYGDCIEALYMQEVEPNEQPLFARIVFQKIRIIELILKGEAKAKFTINGKHVWARKFVPKRTRNFLGESSISSGSGSANN